jgi:AcrR family transcriptional regulator
MNDRSFIMAKVGEDHKSGQRRRILSAAAECFARDGVRGATMRDVAREAGLSPGTIYLYFRNKDDLVGALADAGEAGSAAWNAEAGPEGFDHVLELLRRVGEAPASTSSRLSVRLWAEAVGDEQLGAHYRHAREGWIAHIGASLEGAGLPSGAEPQATAELLAAFTAGLELRRVLDPEADLKPVLKALAALLNAACGRDPPDPDAPVLVG